MERSPKTPSFGPARVLVVDEDAASRNTLREALRSEGFNVREADTVQSAEAAVAEFDPDLLLLELVYTDGTGLDLATRLRNDGVDVGLVIVTGFDAIVDKVAGLAVADDYVTKPVFPAELVARVRAVLRRSAHASEGILRFADLVLNEHTHEVQRGHRRIDLTPREFDLLQFLMLNPKRVLTKDQILANVWHSRGYRGDGRAVETYVSYLRKKLDRLGPPLIHTVRLVGYSLRES